MNETLITDMSHEEIADMVRKSWSGHGEYRMGKRDSRTWADPGEGVWFGHMDTIEDLIKAVTEFVSELECIDKLVPAGPLNPTPYLVTTLASELLSDPLYRL